MQILGSADDLRLTVSDDGRGLDVAAAEVGLGMITMRERVGMIGGTLRVKSRPRDGTRVHVRVPMSQAVPRR